jgi:putative membrane protein
MMGLGFIWMLLFWGGLILLAIWLINLLFPSISQIPPANTGSALFSARDILDQRYARGELSREQYEAMRQTLEQ